MTSLELFPPPDHTPTVPKVWGTGKERGEEFNMWTPKAPTWQYSGEPIEQAYTLTPLQLSNLRLNDELVPDPTQEDMGKVMLDLPFPAEHPYSSHISRTAMFPKFSGQQATSGESAYDVIVLSKTKGSGLRHELQAVPSNSDVKPLHWHSHDFDHLLKYPGAAKQTFYPTPPVLFNPNAEGRSDDNCLRGNMTVAPETSNLARNLERDQWTTTYDRNFTGLGPSNPNKLDNFQDLLNSGDDTLAPSTARTFDPARPVEGRIARALVPPPPPQTDQFPEHQKDPSYTRKMTDSEKAEDLLLNGKEYVNLPERKYHPQWLEPTPSGEPVFAGPRTSQGQTVDWTTTPRSDNAPQVSNTDGSGYIEELALKQHDDFQQMEAENRWKVLELQTPQHNTLARQRKLDQASTKQGPAVFYSHEGTFQRERAGLYNTTYDPYKLQELMNRGDKSASSLVDVSDSHVGALDYPTPLNAELAGAIRYNRTLGNPGSVPQLNSRPSLYEAFEPFEVAKQLQKSAIQPNVASADIRTQEGALISQESTQGDSYNTVKFLQENQLTRNARNEPLLLMSRENQNLDNVRLTTTRAPTAGRPIKAAEDLLTGDPLPGAKWLSRSCDFSLTRPNSSPELGVRYSYSSLNPSMSLDATTTQGLPVSMEMSRIQSRYGVADQLVSKSTNFLPGSASCLAPKSAYQSQFATVKPMTDLSFKNSDERFLWKAGSGMPRPQTKLLDIQNSFQKSDVRKHFHEMFPENGVDIRDNITSGKRHTFSGVNAQVLRGAPVVD